MTNETLAMIVSENWEAAKRGDAFAISAIIGAQAAMKEIEDSKSIVLKQKDGSTFENPEPIVF
tara:strand:- start:1066 stop:1254 length:189 start_codon:yes stop_codon:yes gene_type:complete